jgi:hypothetical protein
MNVIIKDVNSPVFALFAKAADNYKPRSKWVQRTTFEQTHGKTKSIFANVGGRMGRVLLSTDERSQCLCCDKQKSTTVNGVCLDCQQSSKARPV